MRKARQMGTKNDLGRFDLLGKRTAKTCTAGRQLLGGGRQAIIMRRAIGLVLSCAALSGCGGTPGMSSLSLPSVNMPNFNPPGTPVHVTSIPPGAEASFDSDGQRCTTPCTLSAPNGAGTYNVSLKLNGYQPQNVPVRITMSESSSMQSGDAGIAPTTVITPDPVTVELEPFAPTVMKPPAARTNTKRATKTAKSTSPPASSPPPPALPPSPPGTTQQNVFH
jgi:PEGA domain